MSRCCLAGVVLAGAVLALPVQVQAGAWAQPKGKGQLILKAEVLRATEAFDPGGTLQPLSRVRKDRVASFFGEYGLNERVTLQIKGDWQSGEDAFVDYDGRGPVEIGLTWQMYRDDRNALSAYAGYADSGEGRNAGYAAPGVGERDWEVRLSAGRSFGGPRSGTTDRWLPDRSFVEVQAARRVRTGLADEVRADVTVGGHFGRDWMVLGQAFGGLTDGAGARWLSIETSVVRNLGNWSVQAGWRGAVAGRDVPRVRGAVLAVWRRF